MPPKKKAKPPVVTADRPDERRVGETLTIRGQNFRRGQNKNTVAFKRDGGKAVFVKAETSARPRCCTVTRARELEKY